MEVSRTPMNLRFYAGEATRTTGATYPAAGAQPGVHAARTGRASSAAITPWNFPLNIPSRKLGPALAAGNPVLFKPSEITPLMGQRLVEALLDGRAAAGRDRPGPGRRRGRRGGRRRAAGRRRDVHRFHARWVGAIHAPGRSRASGAARDGREEPGRRRRRTPISTPPPR